MKLTGEELSQFSAHDLEVNGKKFQIQNRESIYKLETFSTIHIPNESLNYHYYIAKSATGKYVVCDVRSIMKAPLVPVPNRRIRDGSEKFYDVPVGEFAVLESDNALLDAIVRLTK